MSTDHDFICHWSFRIGGYRSFQLWSTREGARQYLEYHGYDLRMCEIERRHAACCVPEAPLCQPA